MKVAWILEAYLARLSLVEKPSRPLVVEEAVCVLRPYQRKKLVVNCHESLGAWCMGSLIQPWERNCVTTACIVGFNSS